MTEGIGIPEEKVVVQMAFSRVAIYLGKSLRISLYCHEIRLGKRSR